MILCVNKEEMVGVDYDQATNILKKTEGVITMFVANATRASGKKPGGWWSSCTMSLKTTEDYSSPSLSIRRLFLSLKGSTSSIQ